MSSLPSPTPTSLPTLASTLANQFDPALSQVAHDPRNAAWKQLVFGRPVPDTELAGLCGAPTGSTLILSRSPIPTDPKAEQTPDGVMVSIDNPTFFDTPVRLIFHKTATGCGVYVKLVVATKPAPLAYLAGLMLCRMMEQMDTIPKSQLRFDDVSMLAAGGRTWLPMIATTGERWSGWMVWPKYGFDMPIMAKTVAIFGSFPYVPKLKPAPSNVSDLLALDKGPEFWQIVGDGSYMHFDPRPGSRHRDTLLTFMKSKYK